MSDKQLGEKIVELIGGKDNIVSIAHCATRLRIVLKDDSLVKNKEIEELADVKGVFNANGQFQIILGSGLVNRVCNSIQSDLGLNTNEEVKQEPKPQGKKTLMYYINLFIKTLSDIFVPIIPAIVAGGLLMGLNNILTANFFGTEAAPLSIIDLNPQVEGLAQMINTFSSAAFTFLPILIGFSATKKFGGNPYLGAALGMVMVHPDVMNAYNIGKETPEVWNIFGMSIERIGYQGTVLPILVSSFILANIEKGLHKITPTWLDNLTTPLISILFTSFVTYAFIGPVLRDAGFMLADGIQWLYNTLGAFGGFIFGVAYAPIAITGMHHSFIPVETQLIADVATTGGSFIFITASMNNVAQGAAVLATFMLTKNQKLKSLCLPSGASALLGITEPAMFGVNLRLKYPFFGALIGAGVGSAWCAFHSILAQAMGAAGIPGFLSVLPAQWGNFAIGLILAMVTSVVATIVLSKVMKSEDGEN